MDVVTVKVIVEMLVGFTAHRHRCQFGAKKTTTLGKGPGMTDVLNITQGQISHNRYQTYITINNV